MSTHPIFDGILKAASGAGTTPPAPPPVDNDHVAEGCQKFDTSEREALKTILNICDAPHWTAERRWKIREIAATALK